MADRDYVPCSFRPFESVENQRMKLGSGHRVYHDLMIVARDAELSAVESTRRRGKSENSTRFHIDTQQIVILTVEEVLRCVR